MDNTELHYLTYDPDEIWDQMMINYVEAGGDILYPGDEKEMLLRSVQADIVQIFAGVDNALRMQTLRYAVGDYLDVLGELRGCERIPAAAARATVTISAIETGKTDTLEEGTAMTCDGEIFYLLTEDVPLSGYEETLTAEVIADREGLAGNGLVAGSQLELAIKREGVTSIVAATDAVGGIDKEEDDVYRERIRQHNLASISTGPARQYESAAEEVSGEIIDSRAINLGPGHVGVYLILSGTTPAADIIADVYEALNTVDTRPLTDLVDVYQAEDIPYTLNVNYAFDGSSEIAEAISEAVDDYKDWQETTIGTPFNPDKLLAEIYQAGATRVIWGEGSTFNGGEIKYTEISETQRCLGTINMTVIPS